MSTSAQVNEHREQAMVLLRTWLQAEFPAEHPEREDPAAPVLREQVVALLADGYAHRELQRVPS